MLSEASNNMQLPCLMDCALGPHMSFRVQRVSLEILAVLQTSHHWGRGEKLRANSHAQQVKAMSMTGQNPLPVLKS